MALVQHLTARALSEMKMADFVNLVMLVSAAVGSMAFGVLAAYGIFRVAFAILRPQKRRTTVKVRPELAPE